MQQMNNTASPVAQALQRLQHLVTTIPAKLSSIPADEFATKPAPGEWSKQEILGHLVDSAANNHQRFVRTQFEDTPVIFYDGNKWVSHSYYNSMSAEHIIALWALYNQHLATMLSLMPQEYLSRLCDTGGSVVTLQWLIEDYVHHMEHHLSEIIEYS